MKRGPLYYAKNLMLVERNKEWLTSDIKLRHKAAYYPALCGSYWRMATRGQHTVKYLGRDFTFDNPATPLNLQNYPYEITRKILAHIDTAPKTILDIGGNVGHFSVTLKHVLGEAAKVDIFEPNQEIFPILQRNIAGLHGVRAFNYALGAKSHQTKMYFEPGRSGTGSVIKENASDAIRTLNEIAIAMVDSVKQVTKRSQYDLIKIDVEGFEHAVVHALKGLTTKYLFVEVSSGRSKSYDHSEFFRKIEQQLGKFDIVYASPISSSIVTFDALLRFKSVA